MRKVLLITASVLVIIFSVVGWANAAPTIAISDPSVTETVTGPVTYTVFYTGATSITLAVGNITLDATGTATGTVEVTGTGNFLRTVTISNITGKGSLGITIAEGTATDGTELAPEAGPSNTFLVDMPIPVIGDPSVEATAEGPVTYTITYSGNPIVVTLKLADITLNKTGSADGRVTLTGSGDTWTVTIDQITGDGTLSISIAADTATDGINSAPAAGPSKIITVDNTPPTVSISLPDDQPNPVKAWPISDDLFATGAVSYIVTFSEAVTGFTAADVITMDMVGLWEDDLPKSQIKDRIFTAVYPSGKTFYERNINIKFLRTNADKSTSYTVTLYPFRDCTATIKITDKAAQDIANNDSLPSSNTQSVGYDDAPRPRIERKEPFFTNSPTVHFSVEYTEPIYGFGTGDVTIVPISVDGMAGGNKTAVVTGAGEPGPDSIGSLYEVGVSGMTYTGLVRISLHNGRMIGVIDADHLNTNPKQYTWASNNANFTCAADYDGTVPDILTVTLPTPAVGNDPTTGIVTTNSQKGSYTTSRPIIDIAGTVHDDAGINEITWTNDRGESGICDLTPVAESVPVVSSGTPTITISAPSRTKSSGISVVYTVTYTGADSTSLDDADVVLNKTGTADGIITVYPSSDPFVYTVVISQMTGSGDLSFSINAGTALDADGIAANAVGPSSWCRTGAEDWSANAVPLQPGRNLITIAASDAAGNRLNYELTVTCTNSFSGNVVDEFGTHTSIAIDKSGKPRIAYSSGSDLKYAVWDGENWIVHIVDGSGAGNEGANVGQYASLKLDANDNPRISYYDLTNTNLKYAYLTAGGVWIIQNVDGTSTVNDRVGQYCSLSLDSTGRPRISYYDATNGNLKYAQGSAAENPAWVVTTADNNAANVGLYTSLALDSTGRPRISYYDIANGDLKYAQGSAAVNPTWTISTVDTANFVGLYTSLALDTTGRPRISYYNATNRNLKYAEGSAAVNPIWTLSIPDSGWEVGKYSSLALDSDEIPHICYYDELAGDLKYAEGNAAVSPTWSLEVLDDGTAEDGFNALDIGSYCSIALFEDNPHFSYYDDTNNVLKYRYRTGKAASGFKPTCIVTPPSSPTNTTPINFTLTFSSPVTNLDAAKIAVTNGTKGALTQIAPNNGTTYRLVVAPTVDPQGLASVSCTVLAGAARLNNQDNPMENMASNTAIVNYDGGRPRVTVDQMFTQWDPTNDLPINFSISFSEPVTGFTGEDVIISGSAGGTKTVIISGTGTHYNAAVYGATTAGSVIATISQNSCTDAVGNGNLTSTSTNNTVWYDGTRPTCTINKADSQNNPTNSNIINFTATFSEPVAGFSGNWVRILDPVYTDIDHKLTFSGDASFVDANGTDQRRAVITPIGISDAFGNYQSYNVAISGMTGRGTVTLSIPQGAAWDCGNTTNELLNWNEASTNFDNSNSVVYDATKPTVTIDRKSDQPSPTKDLPIRFTVNFSKDMVDFTADDVTLSGTAILTQATKVVTGTGSNYTVEVSGVVVPNTTTGSVTVMADIRADAVHDAAGNGNLTANSGNNGNVVSFDNKGPSVTVNQAVGQSDSTWSSTINYTVIFSEPVTDFGNDDVMIGGTAEATTAVVTQIAPNDGTRYNAVISGMTGDGTVTVSVGTGRARDSLGNFNVASTSTDNTVYYFSEKCAVDVPMNIPDNSSGGIDSIIDLVNYGGVITDLNVKLSITHGSDSDLTAILIGPDGTQVELFSNIGSGGANFTNTVLDDEAVSPLPVNGATAPFNSSYKSKDLLSNFDGKLVNGSWRLNVIDNKAGVAGSLVNWCMQFTVSDATGPTVRIDQAANQLDPTNKTTINFTAVFSKPVTGFSKTDVTLDGTAGGEVLSVTLVPDSGNMVYTVLVGNMNSSGTVTASIPAGVVMDSTENVNLASTSSDNTVTRDIIRPTVTVNQLGALDTVTTRLANFVAVFSEPVVGFGSDKVKISGSALAKSAVVTEIASTGGSKDGTTFKISVTDMVITGDVKAEILAGDPTKIGIEVAADLAGNDNLASTSTDNTVAYQQLDVTINQAAAPQADPTNESPINFTVEFLRSVDDFATGDVLLSGTAGATTAIVTGSGKIYNVAVGGMVRPGTVIASIPANKAFDGGNGNTPSTSTDNIVNYDNVAPTVTINRALSQSNPAGGGTINYTVVFSEPVTGFVDDEVTLVGTAHATKAKVTGSGTTYNVAVTGMTTSGTVIATINAGRAIDAAGNGNAASTSTGTENTVTYDIERPGVNINQAVGQDDPTTESTVNFSVVFTKPVADFKAGDVTITGSSEGTKTVTVTPDDSGAHTIYNVAVSGINKAGTVIASIAENVAHDSANNGNTISSSVDNVIVFDDSIDPKVTVQQALDQVDPTKTNAINFTVTFSEPVIGFAEEDVEISGTAGATDAEVTGSNKSYSVRLTGMTGSGTVTISIPADSVQDLVDNGNEASTSSDDTVTYDITPPTVIVTKTVGQANPVEAPVIYYTIVFSEPVTGFGVGDVVIGGTAGASTAIITEVNAVGGSKNGTTYSAAVSGMFRDGTVTLRVNANVAQDIAGNNNIASAGPVTINYVHPGLSVSINQAPTQADPTRGTPIKYIVVFNKTVTDFTSSDIVLTDTTSGTKVVTITGSGVTYNVSVAGMTKAGTITLTIPANVVHDAVGVGNFASTSTDNTVAFDAERPTVTINQAPGQADPSNANTINFKVVFSEIVTGFATGDVQIGGTSGATTAVVTGSGTTYNVAVSGMVRFGTVSVIIPASVAQDNLNNANVASTSNDNVVTYDQEEPKVTINQATAQADPTMASPVLFTVVFSKAVTGFTSADVALSGTANATAKVVTDSGDHKTYTVAVSGMTKSGTVIPSIPANVAEDSMGIANQASTFTDNTVTYNKPGPSVTINQADDQIDPTKDSQINYAVVFAAPITGFTKDDVTISGTAGATTAVVTGSGAEYAVSISGMTKSGTVIVSIAAGKAQDSGGSLNLASTSTDNSVTFSNVGPKATFGLASGQTNPTKNDIINLSVVFSETVTDFTGGDVIISGTAGATTAVVTGSGKSYNVAITGMTKSGSVMVAIPADKVHNSSNDGNAGADYTITYDITAPAITINFPTNDASCKRNTTKLKLGGTASDNNGVSKVSWSSVKSGSGTCTGKTAWSVSDIDVAASGDTITVTVKDTAGNTATDTIAISVTESLPGDSWISLAMVSLPIIPDDTDPKLEVGFDANSWVCYKPDVNEYAKYPDAVTFLTRDAETPVRGFWARFSGAEKVPCGIIPPQNKEVVIHLVPGWNLIGQPFISPVKWDTNKLKVKVGNTSRTLFNSSDTVREFAYGLDAATGAYYLIYDQTILPEAVGSLAPWQAYWVYAEKECDLIIPAP